LTGLLLGCLINSLPAMKVSVACAEERILEIEVEDDDKNESRELDFALHFLLSDRAPFEIWQKVQFSVCSQASRNERDSHLVRGPPGC
jgi:hypothetical protein